MSSSSRRPLRVRFGDILRRRWPWLLAGALVVAALVAVVTLVLVTNDERAPLRFGDVPDHGEGFSNALYQSVGTPMRAGHHVEMLENGEVFDDLVEEIGRAQSSVHVLQYIWEDGSASERIVATIAERARAGVECRILVDAFGSPDFEAEVGPPLASAGCEILAFRPSADLARNHRKIVVVDGRVAVTGGFGVRDEWLGSGRDEEQWRDTAVRFRGPAVREAQQAFAENWLEAGGEVLPRHAFPVPTHAGRVRAAFVTSTGAAGITKAERLVQLVIHAAKERVWIANAYFVPSPAILEQLVRKSDEGVDVRVLTAGRKSDSKTSWGAQHSKYDDLLEHGVRIWEYEPTMMHSKTILVDDELAIIGTINLDPLSLGELDEAALVVEDRRTNEHLARAFVADCEHGDELSD